jgi:hypothetical protein
MRARRVASRLSQHTIASVPCGGKLRMTMLLHGSRRRRGDREREPERDGEREYECPSS